MKINWKIFAFSALFSILTIALSISGLTYTYNSVIDNFIIATSSGFFLFLTLIFYLIANFDSYYNYKLTKKELFILLTILLVILPAICFLYEYIFGDLTRFEIIIFPFFYAILVIFYLFFVLCFYFKEKLRLK